MRLAIVAVLLTASASAQSGASCKTIRADTFCEVTLAGRITHTIMTCADDDCSIRTEKADDYTRLFHDAQTREIELLKKLEQSYQPLRDKEMERHKQRILERLRKEEEAAKPKEKP